MDNGALIIYSLPGETDFTISKGEVKSEVSPETTWVMRPFDKLKKPIFVQIKSSKTLGVFPDFQLAESKAVDQISMDDYLTNAQKCKDFASDAQGKVVLSRVKILMRKVDVQSSLEGYRKMYPDSLVYFFHAPQIGSWMGATPETLLSAQGDECTTHALAGTKWGDVLFTQKEFDEQMVVVQDILDRLQDRAVEVGDVKESTYGKLSHLKTEIRWQDETPYSVIAELLHPTAAVMGYPRDEASNFIASIESHSREFYTGYLGLIENQSSAHLFVNLRCMQLFRDSAILYAGGGINSQSDPEKEWEECERKFSSIEEALEFDD